MYNAIPHTGDDDGCEVLYLVGGECFSTAYSDCYRFHVDTQQWKEVSPNGCTIPPTSLHVGASIIQEVLHIVYSLIQDIHICEHVYKCTYITAVLTSIHTYMSVYKTFIGTYILVCAYAYKLTSYIHAYSPWFLTMGACSRCLEEHTLKPER